jgi:hypothetical protein
MIKTFKKDLKDKFWKSFRYTKKPIREWYQFKEGRWHPISMLSIKNNFAIFARGIEYASLKEALYHPNFYHKLDAKPNLIGFQNGVYDVKKKKFREGRPNDYLTKSTGYSYTRPDVNDIESVNRFLLDVFSEDEKTRFLNYCLDCFKSYEEKKLWLFSGLFCSGKSTVMSLVEQAFGEYFGKGRLQLPQEADLHKELSHTYGCRLVNIHLDSFENEGRDSILVKELRKLVAGEVRTRNPYTSFIKRLEYQVVMDKPFDAPEDISYQKTEFNMQFVKNPIRINHRLRDMDICDKIPGWKLAFIYIILNQ